MKKNFSMKLISLMLVFTLCFTLLVQPNNVQAASSSSYKKIEQKVNSSGEIIYEILKAGDTYYYFNKDDYNVTSYSFVNGIIDYAVNDGLYLYTGTLNDHKGKMDFDAINDNIQNNFKNTTRKSLTSYLANTSSIASPASINSDESFIVDALNRQGYTEYFDRFLTARYQDGYTVNLYESVYFGITQTNIWLELAGTAIAVISSSLGLSFTQLLSIAAFISTGYGVYLLARDSSFTRYDVTVYKAKDCYYQTMRPYESLRYHNYTAFCGNLSAGLNDEGEGGSTDYYDNAAILDTAILNCKLFYPIG